MKRSPRGQSSGLMAPVGLLLLVGGCSSPDDAAGPLDGGERPAAATPRTAASTTSTRTAEQPHTGSPGSIRVLPADVALDWEVGVVRQGTHLYAVDRAPPSKNRPLARTAAANRARARLARAVARKGAGESYISGVEIVGHWTDPSTGAIFARARLKSWPTPHHDRSPTTAEEDRPAEPLHPRRE